MAEFAIGGIFMLVSVAVSLLGFAFWVWMLIDCLTKEPSEGNDKLIWALVIIVLPAIGALLYLFVRRPERIDTYGQ